MWVCKAILRERAVQGQKGDKEVLASNKREGSDLAVRTLSVYFAG